MKSRLIFLQIVLLACLWSRPQGSWAQAASRQPYWYAVQNDVLVWKTGASSKSLKEEVTLPNGNRLEPQYRRVMLPTGEEEVLNPDDVVLPSGEIVRGQAAAPAPALSYAPAPLRGGRLRGVVELGASGFDSFIIRTDGRQSWQLEKAEFSNSLVMENLATDEDVRRGLKAYIGQMLDYGVGGRDIHFIVSSGAAAAAVTQHIIQSLKMLGYVVNVVTPAQEATLGLRATLPPGYADRAFVVDLGSANTKLAWLENEQPGTSSTYGAKYFQQGVADSVVLADVRAQAALVPASRRQTCFIIGGVPYELAKVGRQAQEPFTTLKPAEAYADLAGAKLRAGLLIYRALAETTGCQHFIFSWDANFAIGFLLSRP